MLSMQGVSVLHTCCDMFNAVVIESIGLLVTGKLASDCSSAM